MTDFVVQVDFHHPAEKFDLFGFEMN